MTKTQTPQFHIGIDFDNTIAIYDDVFHKHALAQQLISPAVPKTKLAVRAAIRTLTYGNDVWTKLQGLVYGKYMGEATLAAGVEEFFKFCQLHSLKVSIISHRTRYPAKGARFNLHKAALTWIERQGIIARYGIHRSDILFETSLPGKFAQIKTRQCTHFIDDLSEVLLHTNFPPQVKKILYSQKENISPALVSLKDWYAIKNYFAHY